MKVPSTSFLLSLGVILCVLISLTNAAPARAAGKMTTTTAHLVRTAIVSGTTRKAPKNIVRTGLGQSQKKSESKIIDSNNFPKARRVYTTNLLPGFRKDDPALFPPGYGDAAASERTILDVGANNGDEYTLRGYNRGHTVLSFEPSPMVVGLFKRTMVSNRVSLSVVNVRDEGITPVAGTDPLVHTAHRIRVFVPPHKPSTDVPRVYLFPFAVSNNSRMVTFHESTCKRKSKCGKVNRVIENGMKKGGLQVPSYRLDDIILPIDARSIWFMKIDVEGHELQVLQGARQLIKDAKIDYIGLEFSPNRRLGVDWGVNLLEKMYSLGYSCFHLRGFGKCHDGRLKSPSLKCNYPFPTNDQVRAPTFEQYTKVFEIEKGKENGKQHMADLMCKRKR